MKVKKASNRGYNEREFISKTIICYTVSVNVYDRVKKAEQDIEVQHHSRTSKKVEQILKEIMKDQPAEYVVLDAKVKAAVEERYLISIADFIEHAHKVQ